jgi:hypothetical protein
MGPEYIARIRRHANGKGEAQLCTAIEIVETLQGKMMKETRFLSSIHDTILRSIIPIFVMRVNEPEQAPRLSRDWKHARNPADRFAIVRFCSYILKDHFLENYAYGFRMDVTLPIRNTYQRLISYRDARRRGDGCRHDGIPRRAVHVHSAAYRMQTVDQPQSTQSCPSGSVEVFFSKTAMPEWQQLHAHPAAPPWRQCPAAYATGIPSMTTLTTNFHTTLHIHRRTS